MGVGGHAALNGASELLDFAGARPLVYLEQLGSGLFLDQGADVAPYVRTVATLDSVALAPAKLLQLIEHLAEQYESVVEAGPQRGDLLRHQSRLAGQHGDVPVAR